MNRLPIRLSRDAFSLLEVILSIAILGGAMVVIGNGFFAGFRSAEIARFQGQANLIADSTMAQIVSGIIEPQSVSNASVPDQAGWSYSIDVTNADQPGLLTVGVTVAKLAQARTVSVSIVRFVPDPDFDPEESAE